MRCPGDGRGRPALEIGALHLLQVGVGRAGSWYSFLLGAETQTCFPERPALCQEAWGGVRGRAGSEPGSARLCVRVRGPNLHVRGVKGKVFGCHETFFSFKVVMKD